MKVAKVYIEYTNMAVDQAYHYACQGLHVEQGMRVHVDFSNRIVVGFVFEVMEMSESQIAALLYQIKDIVLVLDEIPLMNKELFSLAQYMSKRYVSSFIGCCQVMLPNKLKPKSNAQTFKMETWVIFQKRVTLRGEKQKQALRFMEENKEVKRATFNLHFPTQLTSLIKLEAVVLEQRECVATVEKVPNDIQFDLTIQQIESLEKMNTTNQYHTYLFHGVTGSGKSEVFLQMAKAVIDQGKQVLILVPEISLTPQMVKRVKARFVNQVAIYHSSLNNQEKYEQYRLVVQNKVNIVVGTRSAVFMPFTNLGLIILDEEHDQSYKQDNAPRYHARDIALYRGKHHDCKVLLASATPSLESYARAIKGVYTLVEMPNRIHHSMPKIQLIDMQLAMRNGEHHIISNTLKIAIQDRLQNQEQVILLLNRRGYSPVLRCVDCGHVTMCPHCDLALNYHKSENVLKCHLCGYTQKKQYSCEKCGSHQMKYIGLGTQRLEEYVQECFPSASIVRMDADTTSTKNAHEKLLKKFEKEGDILLGTQMIAKGLDFENVTLVGIVNADSLLNRTDYRCVELTFDLLTQASGRSGRGKKEGEVLIQAYDINHYVMRCVKEHDYQRFFYQEMQFRHLAMYPPYSYLGSMVFLNKDAQIVYHEAQFMVETIRHKKMYCLGPIELLKIKDSHRVRLIVKSKNEDEIAQVFYEVYKQHINNKGKSTIEIDIHPYILE